ncbi:MAG TPA: hypothetical protein VMJ10_25550 [Kofleriaceae bacterium]|nr:hypothetical protein [Kofleriaceae bacterium]
MQRRWLVAVLAAHAVVAAPRHSHAPLAARDREVAAAEQRWTDAERAPAGAHVTQWDAAARAFGALASDAARPQADRILAVRAAVAAIENASDGSPRGFGSSLDEPRGREPSDLDPHDQQIVQIAELARALDPDTDATLTIQLLEAWTWSHHHHYGEAIPLLRELIAHHRDRDVSEPAAVALLETYDDEQDYVALVALADELRLDRAYLAGHAKLADIVEDIHAKAIAMQVRDLAEHARETGDRASYMRAAELALASADSTNADEMLYNAAVLFEQAGAVGRALELTRAFLARYSKSRIAVRVLARESELASRIGDFGAAAAASEAYAARDPTARDAAAALLAAAGWQLALGQLDLAARDVDQASGTARSGDARAQTAAVAVRVVSALLDAGRRRDGARRAAALPRIASAPAPWLSFELARVVADAACPVALVAELCPRARDHALVAIARERLAVVEHDPELGARATRLLLDLALEGVRADRADPRPPAALLAAYGSLATSARSPELRAIANERLARLAGDRTAATTALRTCISASADAGAPVWVATCERELAALDPDTSAPDERVPRALAPLAPPPPELP